MASPDPSNFAFKKDGQLAVAACRGDVEKIARLIGEGANPNALSKKEGSVLVSSIKCQSEAGVMALLKGGANSNQSPTDGDWSPLMVASAFDNPRVIEILVQEGANRDYVSADVDTATPLEVALVRGVESGNWTAYDKLLALGADINVHHGEMGNVAEKAAVLGQMDKVLSLLNRGYRHALPDLAKTVSIVQGNEKMTADKKRVLARLKDLGVTAS